MYVLFCYRDEEALLANVAPEMIQRLAKAMAPTLLRGCIEVSSNKYVLSSNPTENTKVASPSFKNINVRGAKHEAMLGVTL